MQPKIYTPAVEAQLKLDFENGKTPEQLAEILGVSHRSVIAKLSSMGLYKRKGYTDKKGEIPVRKSEYVDRIAVLLKQSPERLESLEKANKLVLRLIEDALLAKQ